MDAKTWGLIGLTIIIIIALLALNSSAKAQTATAADLATVAASYNALQSGTAPDIKAADLSTITILPTKLLSIDGSNPA